MNRTATNHPQTATGRRRAPAVIALAMAAGVVLGACSADSGDGIAPSPTTRTSTSSSSSTPAPTTTASDTAEPVSAPPAPAPPVAAAPATQLPANVVGTGGPCQMLGEVAQAQDGSALFCTEDPGGAGPLWLPQAGADPGGGGVADATGQARPGGPCAQEGLAVTGVDGAVLTCRLTGGGDVPGGLYWQ
ncbi:hypothetical protein [Dietzia sp. B32]|uniref:hypothetical protein n=1 Tax=Dietzia sp. B32 TaxID=2915130 RepID=UPI0021ADBE7F|nr:hypothetical protein [Dietzia sp. B32]UVE93944.1 hypothetical protein L8M95_10215 [Dietzia sp. B32]